MSLIRVIGDIHGVYGTYDYLIGCPHPTIQIGDMGVGFPGLNHCRPAPKDRFFNGNHDNPQACRAMDAFMGTWGSEGKVFWLGGGWSIDQAYRVPGISWWADEELSHAELEEAIEAYRAARPSIMLSHEAPAFLARHMVQKVFPPSRTALALGAMWEAHRPRLWLYGHWHLDFRKRIEGCEFVCVNQYCAVDVDLGAFEVGPYIRGDR